MEKKNLGNMFKVGVLSLCVSVFLLLFSPVVHAKVRFSVGFTADWAIESPRISENWQYTEMGSVFWPIIYGQLWAMGPAPDYKPVPRLATRWETKDRKTWRFYLRKNARFSDGKPVTARDVEFSLTYVPQNVESYNVPDVQCESIKVIDDYTIEFTLKKKLGGDYPPAYWFPILPKHIWEPYKKDMKSFANEKAIGSGPYKLKEFKSKQYVWFVVNKDFWGKKPAVDELVYKCYGSREALNMALKKGDVDMIGYSGINPVNLPEFQKAKNIKVIISPGIGLIWLTFNLHKATPIQDLSVRKACMEGIDLDRIIKLDYRGYAKKVNSFIYPEMASYDPNLPMWHYDPKAAEKTLEQAGYVDKDNDGIRNDPKTGKNLNFDLMVPTDWTTEVKLATLIKQQLAPIGIGISLKTLDLDTYYDFIYAPKDDKWDIAIGEEEPGPYADWIWEMSRGYNNGGEGWNQAYYNNPKFDTLLDELLSETDMTKRKQTSFKMQEIIAHDLPYAVILRPDIIDPVRTDKFEGYVQTMGGVITWINPWTLFDIKPKK